MTESLNTNTPNYQELDIPENLPPPLAEFEPHFEDFQDDGGVLAEQLGTAFNFARDRVAEHGVDDAPEDYGDMWAYNRFAPQLHLANGAAIACSETRFTEGTDIASAVETSASVRVNVMNSGDSIVLSFNTNGTLSLDTDVRKGSVNLDSVPLDHALTNPAFVAAIGYIHHTIVEELPKPFREYVPRKLSASPRMIFENPRDSHESSPGRVTFGFDEVPLKGQDALLVDMGNNRAAVADGVGEDANSGTASRLALSVIQEHMNAVETDNPHERLAAMKNAVNEASLEISAWQNADVPVGSTTLTLAEIIPDSTDENRAYVPWVSVGDSRLYVRDSDGLRQVSVDEGEDNRIYNWLGNGYRGINDAEGEHGYGLLEISKGTDIILVTDGITGDVGDQIMPDHELLAVLEGSGNPNDAAANLIDASRKRDDKSVVIMRF
jgi:serine/threonine protein phosphatase PrpC